MSTEYRSAGGFVEEHRELLFVVGLLVGMTIFAFGFAFFVLGIAMDTTPPAPYFASTTDRLLTIGLSIAGLVVGAGIIRRAASVAGW